MHRNNRNPYVDAAAAS